MQLWIQARQLAPPEMRVTAECSDRIHRDPATEPRQPTPGGSPGSDEVLRPHAGGGGAVATTRLPAWGTALGTAHVVRARRDSLELAQVVRFRTHADGSECRGAFLGGAHSVVWRRARRRGVEGPVVGARCGGVELGGDMEV